MVRKAVKVHPSPNLVYRAGQVQLLWSQIKGHPCRGLDGVTEKELVERGDALQLYRCSSRHHDGKVNTCYTYSDLGMLILYHLTREIDENC